MIIITEHEAWQQARQEIACNAVCVKRSDVDVFTTDYAHGLIAQPAILLDEVRNDGQLFAYVRIFAGGDPVIVVGHGWDERERFLVSMTVKEFIQHWQGD